MAHWHTHIDQFARQSDRELILLPQGRGVGFRDGFDVCWLIPDDVLSTLPVPADESAALQTIAEIERIEEIRRDVVHVLRHYLASKRYGIRPSRSGHLGIQSEGGLESSLSVGAYLTTLARDGSDVAACLAKLIENTIVRHVPSARRIQRYLDTPGDPPNERGFEDKSITLGGTTMASILKMMNLCRAADAIPDNPTATDGQQFVDRIGATGPVGEALLRVGERLPDVKPSFELLENAIILDFPDGIDSISLKVKSRAFIRSIRENGPIMAGDLIADDFERLSRLRALTLHAIDTAAANLGWMIEQARTGLFSGSTVWHLGLDVRIRTIDVGHAMTESLRKSSPEMYVRTLAGGPADDFKAACLDALHKGGQLKPQSWLTPRGRLAPSPPARVPTLVSLSDTQAIADADRWAAETLRAFRQSDDLWRKLNEQHFFDPDKDTWLTTTDIESLAAEASEESWYYARAIRMQLKSGRAGADEKAKDLVKRTEMLYEVSDDLIALAWQYRNEFPELAKQNFLPRQHEDVPNAEARAKAGDPIAQRYIDARSLGKGEEAEPAWLEVLPPALRVNSRRQQVIEWAKREWRWSMVDIAPFELAIREGWTELADSLDDNQHILNTLLTQEVRGQDGMDEPGILMAEKLLLAWSHLRPTPLLARLILTARSIDTVGEARAAGDAAALRNPKLGKRDVTMAAEVMASWWQQMQPPMAIAWTRWRNTQFK